MSRSLWILAALVLACSAFAAPAPKPFAGGWGNPIDPDKDCKIRREGDALTIEMPGRDHDYDPLRKRFNAPRLLRDVDGVFEVQVRVQIDGRPSAHSTAKGLPSCVSGGFLVIYPESGRFICDRFEFGVSQPGIGRNDYAVRPILACTLKEARLRKGIGADGYASLKIWDCTKQKIDMSYDRESPRLYHSLWDRGWSHWPLSPLPRKTSSAYLRLRRRDGWFNLFLSADGEKWTELCKYTDHHMKIKLGLAAYSTSSEPSKVQYHMLTITRGRKGER